MKKKNQYGKLSLNKTTIAILKKNELIVLKGGLKGDQSQGKFVCTGRPTHPPPDTK